MICKKDVILWFKELESYKRIDTMCTLLNMCLPFELRFLGTCLEELGRRDSQELRGIELRVNNPQDLAADMVACQKGEPTDKKIRRKMALYLALIRACNRTCVSEIFRTLDGWGERDFLSMNDTDTLQELLLVYTMAANHPVFSFDQHMKCNEIFEKIKENKLMCDQAPSGHQQSDQGMGMGQHQQDIRQHLPPTHPEMLHQHPLHAMHLSGQHPQLMAAGPIQVLPQASIPMNFPQAHLTKLIPGDGSIQHQITVDGIPHMISSNITIPADSNTILAHPNATWTLRYPPPGPSLEQPPQSSSPMLSQQSSPSSSRATSPNRTPTNSMMQQGIQTQQVRNIPQRMSNSLKHARRPSAETTPPPMSQQQQIMGNEILMPQNMKHMDDVVMNNEGLGHQLQTLIRNGFTRTGHHLRLKSGNYIPPHQQQSPVNQHFQPMTSGNFTANTGLTYCMQNMSMSDGTTGAIHNAEVGGMMGMNSNKSGGSDSGSSMGSSGEISPPETPTLISNTVTSLGGMRLNSDQQPTQQQKHHQQQLSYNKQMNRLNGRSDKLLSVSAGGNCNVSTGSTIIYAPSSTLTNTHQQLSQQQQQQSQQLYGTDIILAPGGNAGATNLMQTSLSNNNNGGAGNNIANSSSNVASSNNNMTTNTVLISTPSGGGGGLIGNVITSNSVILQSHQQQYNAAYPYHAAAAAAQHLASTSRPPLITHNPGMAPPPPGTFRLPGFQLPHNGELIYPAYHPAGLTFLSSGAPPVAMRSSNAAPVNSNTSGGVPPPQLQQQPPPPQQMQPPQSIVPNAALLNASSYSTVAVGVNKPMSCYNCGSQVHCGRDCQEASMDDVSRSAIYKLDYSVSASNASPTTIGGPNLAAGGGNDTLSSSHHQKQHTMDSNVAGVSAASSISSHSSTPGVINTK